VGVWGGVRGEKYEHMKGESCTQVQLWLVEGEEFPREGIAGDPPIKASVSNEPKRLPHINTNPGLVGEWASTQLPCIEPKGVMGYAIDIHQGILRGVPNGPYRLVIPQGFSSYKDSSPHCALSCRLGWPSPPHWHTPNGT
jgi:hypothetical protein